MEDNKNKTLNENGDSFVIGKGFNVQEIDNYNGSNKHRKHSKSEGKAVLSAVTRVFIIIIVSLLLAASIILFTADYLGIGIGRGRDVVVEIPQGASTIKIAEILKQENAISNTFLFRVYSKLKGYDGKYQYGVYTFNNEAGYEHIADLLLTEGAKPDSVMVTIPERSSVDDIAALLTAKGVCSKADFYKALNKKVYKQDFIAGIPESSVYYRFEGYLFPETYDFYCYDSEECAVLAIDKMLSQTQKVLNELGAEAKANEMNYTVHEILTMASIVELEASAYTDKMASVAQVFYNRLETWENPLLGSSPTAKYKYGSGRYNTNIYPGLPPGPYCSPSRSAINAALNPDKSCTATYFVTDAKMNFYFTYSLQEHNKIIAKLKAEKNWIYEQY